MGLIVDFPFTTRGLIKSMYIMEYVVYGTLTLDLNWIRIVTYSLCVRGQHEMTQRAGFGPRAFSLTNVLLKL